MASPGHRAGNIARCSSQGEACRVQDGPHKATHRVLPRYSLLSPPDEEQRQIKTPRKNRGALRVLPTLESPHQRAELVGGGRGRDAPWQVQDGGREKSISRQQADPTHPWPCCRWKEDGVWEVGGAVPRPQFSQARRIISSHRSLLMGFSSCCKDISSLRPSIACPGSEGAALSQPTETLQTVSTCVTGSPPKAQGQPGPAICEQLLPAL